MKLNDATKEYKRVFKIRVGDFKNRLLFLHKHLHSCCYIFWMKNGEELFVCSRIENDEVEIIWCLCLRDVLTRIENHDELQFWPSWDVYQRVQWCSTNFTLSISIGCQLLVMWWDDEQHESLQHLPLHPFVCWIRNSNIYIFPHLFQFF